MPSITEWKVPAAFQPRPEDYRYELDRALTENDTSSLYFQLRQRVRQCCGGNSRLFIVEFLSEARLCATPIGHS